MIRLPCPPAGVPESCQERRNQSGRARVPCGTPRPLAPGQLVLRPSHALSTRRSSGRSHSLSPSGQPRMAPEGSSGLDRLASWSSSSPAAAPGHSCRATAMLQSPPRLPQERGCWRHLGLAALRQPSHVPLGGSPSCPVTVLQSRGLAHGLDCPALLRLWAHSTPSSSPAPLRPLLHDPLSPAVCQALSLRAGCSARGGGGGVERPFWVELGALEEISWLVRASPVPTPAPRVGRDPVPGEAFLCKGLRYGAPSACLGPTVPWGGAAALTLQHPRTQSRR